MKKTVRDLVPGNVIQVGNNKTATIKSISKGFFLNSRLVIYSDGLQACYFDTDPVTVLNG